jgi:PAS domain S-box-containing protein
VGSGTDLTGLREDGAEFPVAIIAGQVVKSEANSSVAFITDVTDRKRTEVVLGEDRERLILAQEVAQIGTFDWNIETGVNQWSPELEAIYGLPPGGFAGTQEAWEQLVHPEDRPGVRRLVTEALQDGRDFKAEWRVIWPDGTVRWVTGKASVIRDAGGNPQHLIGINIDITQREQVKSCAAGKRAAVSIII